MSPHNKYDFYQPNKKISSMGIKDVLSDYIINININSDFKVQHISSIDNIYSNSAVFINFDKEFDSNLDEILIITNNKNLLKKYKNCVLVNDINKSFKALADHIYIHDDTLNYNDEFNVINNSSISKFAKIDPSVKIGRNCVIGRGVSIGKDSIIKNNVVIKNAILSDNIIVSDNTTIGCTGFGFDLTNMGSVNLSPHIGIVHIDENVSIGSNCSIDKAKIDITYIGKNSMIDNLVHIAHNVIIGDNACIAAQTGIAGSVKIGRNLICGGQSAFAGHITIGDNVLVAGKSGVTKNLKDNSSVAGFPATDINKWKKSIILNRKKNV
jgi:UDP-3-O-[3-hydroxymyristoyl] glucosamine N-acyltransferase